MLFRYVHGWRGEVAGADGPVGGGHALLKVKDWPADKDFAEALARHYQVRGGGGALGDLTGS